MFIFNARPLLCGGVLCALLVPMAGQAAGQDGRPCLRRFHLSPAESEQLTGVYELQNGGQLRVRREVNRYYADLVATGRIEVVPVDPDEFVERNGPVRLYFERLPFATDVRIAGLDGKASGPPACK